MDYKLELSHSEFHLLVALISACHKPNPKTQAETRTNRYVSNILLKLNQHNQIDTWKQVHCELHLAPFNMEEYE